METGEKIKASYHYKIINKLLGKNLKGYMKCTYEISSNLIMWFIPLDGIESKDGWVNTLENKNYITEIYTGDQSKFMKGHSFSNTQGKLRAVFDYDKRESNREYVFRGIFKEEVGSENFIRGWKKVSDNLIFMKHLK